MIGRFVDLLVDLLAGKIVARFAGVMVCPTSDSHPLSCI